LCYSITALYLPRKGATFGAASQFRLKSLWNDASEVLAVHFLRLSFTWVRAVSLGPVQSDGWNGVAFIVGSFEQPRSHVRLARAPAADPAEREAEIDIPPGLRPPLTSSRVEALVSFTM
jgi:hypothetical protein